MTERFTEKMLIGKMELANTILKRAGIPFEIHKESQTLERRTHRFFLRQTLNHNDHDLTYPYGQDTGNAYLNMRAITELLSEIERYLNNKETA